MEKWYKSKHLIGNKLGDLTIIGLSQSIFGEAAVWICSCKCGNEYRILASEIVGGNINIACGCKLDNSSINGSNQWNNLELGRTETKIRDIRSKNENNHKKLLRIRRDIIDICYNPNNDRYKNYGDKGISVYYKWIEDIKEFIKWSIENGYREDLKLDRINRDGDFNPNNCVWIHSKNEKYRINKGINKRVIVDNIKNIGDGLDSLSIDDKNKIIDEILLRMINIDREIIEVENMVNLYNKIGIGIDTIELKEYRKEFRRILNKIRRVKQCKMD